MQEQERGEQDEAAVTEFMQQLAQLPTQLQLPDPAYLWCRVGLLHRTPSGRRVLRLLTIFDAAEVAACLAAAVGVFYVAWAAVWNPPL